MSSLTRMADPRHWGPHQGVVSFTAQVTIQWKLQEGKWGTRPTFTPRASIKSQEIVGDQMFYSSSYMDSK